MRGIDKAHIGLAVGYVGSLAVYLAGFFSMHSGDLFYDDSRGDFVKWFFLEISTVICPTIGLLLHISILFARHFQKWKAVAILAGLCLLFLLGWVIGAGVSLSETFNESSWVMQIVGLVTGGISLIVASAFAAKEFHENNTTIPVYSIFQDPWGDQTNGTSVAEDDDEESLLELNDTRI